MWPFKDAPVTPDPEPTVAEVPVRDPEIKLFDSVLDDTDVEFRFEDGGLTVRPLKWRFSHEQIPTDPRTEEGVIHLVAYGQPYLTSGSQRLTNLLYSAGEKGVLALPDLYVPWSRVISVKVLKKTPVPIRFEWKNCEECRQGRCLRAR